MHCKKIISPVSTVILGLLLVNSTLTASAITNKRRIIRNLPVERCLPKDIKLSDVVSRDETHNRTVITTVEQKLKQLKARCRSSDKKLIAASGKPIYFYKLTGCWGNAPANYQEILRKQQEEIEKLRASYTVIEITCNPTGALFPSAPPPSLP